MNDDHYVKKMFGTTFHVFNNIFHLIFSMPFLVLTVVGNSVVFLFAGVLWHLEGGGHPKIESFVDCLWWSFATATTVGYGDITPQTSGGKFLGMFLMLIGTAIFAIYTAFFAKAIMGEEFAIRPRKIK